MKDVLEDVDSWTARGDAVALATVISVKRSAPRPPGSKMAVNEHGEISGAVSGGCVEGAVVEVAEEVIGGGGPRLGDVSPDST
jgi:xanthine dehydrogenase accessory factor